MREVVYGRHAVFHLLKAGRRRPYHLYLLRGSERVDDPAVGLARERQIPVEVREASFFAKWEGAQGILVESDPYPFRPLEHLLTFKTVLICDGLQDPQNLGAVCRSAFLLGAGGVVITENRAAPISAGVCKAASGAVEYLDIARVTSLAKALEQLKKGGFWVYGADPGADKVLYREQFPEKVGVVIGGEGGGLGRLVRERCDILLKIPMGRAEIGSFNAATAAALILGEVQRQRNAVLNIRS